MPRRSTSTTKMPGLKVTATELARDGAIKYGNLWKAGNFRKTMHERFFVLRPSCYMFYFKKPTDTVPAGVAEVVKYEAKMEQDIRDQDDGYQFPFKIQSRDNPRAERVFHLEAASDAERKQWFEAFEKMKVLSEMMRGGTAQIEETKAQIADLQERLRDKEVALTALRNATSAGAAGAGAGATASYKAEIKSLQKRLETAQAQVAKSNAKAGKLQDELLQAQVTAAALTSAGTGGPSSSGDAKKKKKNGGSTDGDDAGANTGAAIAAATAKLTTRHREALVKKDAEIARIQEKYETLLNAQVGALAGLHALARSMKCKLKARHDVVKATSECQAMVKAAIKKARAAGEASAKKAAAKAAKAAKAAGAGDSSDDEEVKQSGARSGAGTRTEAGAGAGAGPGSGSGRTGSSTAPTSLTAEEKGDFSKLREASKAKVSVKELDRLPPPWFPDRHIAKCQMCAKSFNVFRRKHHCRRCGRCICASCAPDRCRKELPEFGYREKVRQCVDCYDLFAIW